MASSLGSHLRLLLHLALACPSSHSKAAGTREWVLHSRGALLHYFFVYAGVSLGENCRLVALGTKAQEEGFCLLCRLWYLSGYVAVCVCVCVCATPAQVTDVFGANESMNHGIQNAHVYQ